jgi:hypothetical protein
MSRGDAVRSMSRGDAVHSLRSIYIDRSRHITLAATVHAT